ATGTVQARRAMAGLLLARGTASAIDALLDQLADPEMGEQVLQLLRAELDRQAGKPGKTAALIEKAALARAGALGKRLRSEWAGAVKAAGAAGGKKAAAGKKKKAAARTSARSGKARAAAAPAASAAQPPPPSADPVVAATAFELGLLLRLIGYQARPASLPLLITHASEDQPRAIRLAAIAAMRRV